ncbi:MAG TPA: NAD-dependent epimerase/dehydratase family protein [Streptosporangiaceae bacterium]|jgi:dTDP-L-rhamnose 4-epimerase
MRILITGGAGFIGAHAAAAFAASGWDVRTLDLAPGAAPPGVEAVTGDVRDPGVLARCLDGADVVCHQAAKVGLGVDLADMPAYMDVNATGTAALLAAMGARGIGRLVLASSMVVYGEGGYTCPAHGSVRPAPRDRTDLAAGRFDPRCGCGAALHPMPVAEDAPLDPRNAYAVSKLAQEHLAAVWARETGGAAIALRYHNVYGPGMPRDTPYAGVAAIFRSALLRGAAPRVFEDGAQRRDFVHVRDVAAACVAAAGATGSAGAGALRPYNVGSGHVRTVGDLADALADAHGGPRPVVTGEFRLGDVRHITADSGRIRAELGFRPSVEFADGVAEFAATA